MLDEPTNHLDVRAQIELLELVHGLTLTTIVAMHDLDHAAAICDRISILHGGRVAATGPPLDVLTPGRIADVFGVAAHIGTHPITGTAQISVAALNHHDATTEPTDLTTDKER